jgi:hypothetical protein
VTLSETIKQYRNQSQAAFYMADYEEAAQLARVADWLEELAKARVTIEMLKADLEETKF